jgi:ABC-type amino acid transport substrate-binding protein
MKKWTIALSLACAALSGAVHAADLSGREIRLAVDPTYPPLEFKLADGTLTGFGVDITTRFAHRCMQSAHGSRRASTAWFRACSRVSST